MLYGNGGQIAIPASEPGSQASTHKRKMYILHEYSFPSLLENYYKYVLYAGKNILIM